MCLEEIYTYFSAKIWRDIQTLLPNLKETYTNSSGKVILFEFQKTAKTWNPLTLLVTLYYPTMVWNVIAFGVKWWLANLKFLLQNYNYCFLIHEKIILLHGPLELLLCDKGCELNANCFNDCLYLPCSSVWCQMYQCSTRLAFFDDVPFSCMIYMCLCCLSSILLYFIWIL